MEFLTYFGQIDSINNNLAKMMKKMLISLYLTVHVSFALYGQNVSFADYYRFKINEDSLTYMRIKDNITFANTRYHIVSMQNSSFQATYYYPTNEGNINRASDRTYAMPRTKYQFHTKSSYSHQDSFNPYGAVNFSTGLEIAFIDLVLKKIKRGYK